jgi:hypothetical protein
VALTGLEGPRGRALLRDASEGLDGRGSTR